MSKNRVPEIGRWFFRFAIGTDFYRMDSFVKRVDIAILKKIAESPENARPIRGKHYRGFHFVLYVRVPAYVGQWR